MPGRNPDFTVAAPPTISEYEGKLRCWREHEQVYEDEYVARDRWKGEKVIAPSLDRRLEVLLAVTIRGKRDSKRRLKPCRWYAWVSLRGYAYQVDVADGTCTSVADAIRKVEGLDTQPATVKLLKQFYNPLQACMIWRKTEGTHWDLLLGYPHGAEPWCVWFGSGRVASSETWPIGEYFTVPSEDLSRPSYTTITLSYSFGGSASGTPDWLSRESCKMLGIASV